MYFENKAFTPELKKVRRLPANLFGAIRQFEFSKVVRSAFGDELVNSYAKLCTPTGAGVPVKSRIGNASRPWTAKSQSRGQGANGDD
jgi:hypothetical protein